MLYFILRSNFILRLSVSLSAAARVLEVGLRSAFFGFRSGVRELSTGVISSEARLNPFARDYYEARTAGPRPATEPGRVPGFLERSFDGQFFGQVECEFVVHCDGIPAQQLTFLTDETSSVGDVAADGVEAVHRPVIR